MCAANWFRRTTIIFLKDLLLPFSSKWKLSWLDECDVMCGENIFDLWAGLCWIRRRCKNENKRGEQQHAAIRDAGYNLKSGKWLNKDNKRVSISAEVKLTVYYLFYVPWLFFFFLHLQWSNINRLLLQKARTHLLSRTEKHPEQNKGTSTICFQYSCQPNFREHPVSKIDFVKLAPEKQQRPRDYPAF